MRSKQEEKNSPFRHGAKSQTERIEGEFQRKEGAMMELQPGDTKILHHGASFRTIDKSKHIS